jgi:hypothetical protein
MYISNRHLLNIVWGVCMLVTSMTSLAGKPGDITSAEMALLPRYCPDTQGFNYGDASYKTSPNADKWVAIMGPGFWHVHHHCWALLKLHRADRSITPAIHKRGLRESAIQDFWYVVHNAPSDFVLLPEIYTWIGRTEVLLDHPKNAGEAFVKAQTTKPDYWPAYSHWAEALMAKGSKADAMKVVKNGLQYSPNAKPLLELFSRLGGKSGDMPTPILKTEPSQEVSNEESVKNQSVPLTPNSD